MTRAQLHCLSYLARFAGSHPSSHMRSRQCPNPGDVLRRLSLKGLVEATVNMPPEGMCYRITNAGMDALVAEAKP